MTFDLLNPVTMCAAIPYDAERERVDINLPNPHWP